MDTAYDDPRLRGAWEQLDVLITPPGWSNAPGQKLVQLDHAGVPDVYQAPELWDDSLVDPGQPAPGRLCPNALGCSRCLATHRQPSTRPARREAVDRPKGLHGCVAAAWLFSGYQAGQVASGPAQDHLVGFDRGGAITLATRLPVGLAAQRLA